MDRQDIMRLVSAELERAKKKHPNWPDHMVARGAIVAEEAGELVRACLNWKYERKKFSDDQQLQYNEMVSEAVQTIVTGIRFLENLKPLTNE
jgi:NTP pyrophosphatase (non-canonical NTP hydrolase)